MNDLADAVLLGTRIGDALAMPVHWYYDRTALRRDYGIVDRFMRPKPFHPDSILWRSKYEPTEPEFDILGAEREVWGKRNVHYHRNLIAGENTLNVKLLVRALAQVQDHGEYDRSSYIDLYLDLLTHPERHRDTYVEECHRGFFINLRRGVKPERCAVQEKHIGGMTPAITLYLRLLALDPDRVDAKSAVKMQVLDHIALTHAGELVRRAAKTLLVIADELLAGEPLRSVLTRHAERQDLEYFTGPIMRLLDVPDQEVIGRIFSPACYLDHSVPATLFLALKYADDPEAGLIANTMVGGDNAGRGAVLGAIYGLAHGAEVFPRLWREGLAVTPYFDRTVVE